MSNPPLVSVIVPVYNTERYLDKCIDSVLNQTFRDYELLLVDDGSTDQSGLICDAYEKTDSRITVIHKPNGGQSSARNVALDRATGKYVYFLDSDDYIGRELLGNLYTTAEENRADVVFFEAKSFYDNESNESGESKDFSDIAIATFVYKRERQYIPCNAQEQYVQLREHNEYYVCTPLHFYRKDYLNRNAIRFREGIIHEDNLFSAEVYLSDGLTAHLSSYDYYRRLRPESTMTSRDQAHLQYRISSLLSVYQGIDSAIRMHHTNRKMMRLLITDSVNDILYSYEKLDDNDQKLYRAALIAVKRHALLHYGWYDYQLARTCSGAVLRPFVRGIHFLGSHLWKK